MTIETKTDHFYFVYGRWVEGWGGKHRCGHPDEPCVTLEWQREVSDWTPTTLTSKP